MLKRFQALLCALLTIYAPVISAGDAVIFQGSGVKALKPNLYLLDSANVLTGTADPTSVAQSGGKGSLYLRQAAGDGELYLKKDAGSSTNWDLVQTTSGVALTASRAVASDASGYLTSSATTATELGYVNGVTSAIQTQLNGKVDEVVSTDNAIVRFDGTGGSVQNSGVTISDLNAIAGAGIDADANTVTNIENADIKAGAAIDRTKIASGTASHVVINDGSGVLSSEAALSPTRGGTGVANGAGETITLTGDDTIEFTTTAATSVTLPTSGTLATNAAATPTTAGLVTSFTPTAGASVLTSDSATVTLNTTDGYDVVVLTAGSSTVQTVNLPAVASNLGRKITIVKSGSSSGIHIIDPNSSETIDDASLNNLVATGAYVTIVGSDEATDQWRVVDTWDLIENTVNGSRALVYAAADSNTTKDLTNSATSIKPGRWFMQVGAGYLLRTTNTNLRRVNIAVSTASASAAGATFPDNMQKVFYGAVGTDMYDYVYSGGRYETFTTATDRYGYILFILDAGNIDVDYAMFRAIRVH
jgi:hypothetical protein